MNFENFIMSFFFSPFIFIFISLSHPLALSLCRSWSSRNVQMLRELNGIPWYSLNVKQSYKHMMIIYGKNIEKFMTISLRYAESVYVRAQSMHNFRKFNHFYFASSLAFQMHTSQNDMFMWCCFGGSAYILFFLVYRWQESNKENARRRVAFDVIKCVLHLFARWALRAQPSTWIIEIAFLSDPKHNTHARTHTRAPLIATKSFGISFVRCFITVKSYFMHFYGARRMPSPVIMEIKMRR